MAAQNAMRDVSVSESGKKTIVTARYVPSAITTTITTTTVGKRCKIASRGSGVTFVRGRTSVTLYAALIPRGPFRVERTNLKLFLSKRSP